MEQIPPAEDHPYYADWRLAHGRLKAAAGHLVSLSHLPEDDPQLLKAHDAWMEAKAVYEAVCAKRG